MSVCIRFDDTEIRSYTHGWILVDIKVYPDDHDDAGEEYDSTTTYHGSLSQALIALQERIVRNSDAESVQGLAESLRGYQKRVLNVIEGALLNQRG